MLNYTVGSDNLENGMICYYGEDEVISGYPKRKFEEDTEEGFEKGNRKKRYILGQNVGKWTDEEHNRFVSALKKFGRNWTLVQQEVKTRTLVQIRSHAQKYFLKKVRGIAPSTLTMDSKLISTASDGIVPTWLLQDDSNFANKTSINTSSNINPNNTMVNTNGLNNSGKSSNNIGGMNLYIYNESSNPDLSIIDEPINLVNVCNNNNLETSNNNSNNNNNNHNDNSCINDNINSNITGNCTSMDNSNLVISGGMIGGMNILGNTILESGLSPDIRYSNYMGNSLLVDDQRDQCTHHDYRTGLMDLKTDVTPRLDYSPQGGGGLIPKQIVNDCIFDEPYSDKRASVDSTSLVSTAVSSPASISPEKNYIPASSMGLDMLLMPPTVEMEQNDNSHPNSFQKGSNGYSNNKTCNTSNNNPRCNTSSISSNGNSNNNNKLREDSLGIIPESLSYGLNYNFEDNENIINPSITLSNCDVPWPLTGDQFLHFNESDNAISSSPSASSSISYLDLDSSSETKHSRVSASPNKQQYDMGNTFSDFVYCGDSLGVDLLNVYTNLRDSSSPIIDNADVTEFI
ncbi:Myb-like DNA-binding domain protein [Cryptosporidium meleagridis]|uniref:Myb-like DNA-binding domain protein n=1 Tax=Cryptosporidium meleagridis TaxID=93969 RepID=A0A2P4Z158_9CRYT|nr:Myb-like DNA-binding domain protein [Cryptosporidium meleagridis]